MARMKEEIKKLEEERSRLDARIAELENNLFSLKGERSGLDRALAILAGRETAAETTPRKERARGVKETVLAAVQNAGKDGITVGQLLDRTQREGIHLERGTVSSLLSRFKREGVLEMEDGRYFIPQSEVDQEAIRREMMN